ncbi:MAG TPA: hypothetical protein ENK06_10865 [Gammaproteobacteria bacterium]|nr:hypothetical protein [Gammaproteobacteria bacterium]
MTRVAVNPELLNWALVRAGLHADPLFKQFPKINDWLQGEGQPIMKLLEKFARKTHTAIGYFFLPEPPVETLPIPDFRTLAYRQLTQPSPDLLDTLYAMQQRQAWLREDRIECEAEPLDFVGSATQNDEPEAVGREMRRLAGFEEGWASSVGSWRDAVSALRRAMDLRLVDRAVFFDFYQDYIKAERKQKKETAGGNFYNNQNTRVGELFATQVIRAAMEGRVGFWEAYNLTGLHGGTFQKYARRLGFNPP